MRFCRSEVCGARNFGIVTYCGLRASANQNRAAAQSPPQQINRSTVSLFRSQLRALVRAR